MEKKAKIAYFWSKIWPLCKTHLFSNFVLKCSLDKLEAFWYPHGSPRTNTSFFKKTWKMQFLRCDFFLKKMRRFFKFLPKMTKIDFFCREKSFCRKSMLLPSKCKILTALKHEKKIWGKFWFFHCFQEVKKVPTNQKS